MCPLKKTSQGLSLFDGDPIVLPSGVSWDEGGQPIYGNGHVEPPEITIHFSLSISNLALKPDLELLF